MARRKNRRFNGLAGELVGDDLLKAVVEVSNPAVAGSNPQPAKSVQSKEIEARLDQEYISGGGYVWLATYLKSLPFYVDDLTRDFGEDIYERMGNDPQVRASVAVLKGGVLAQGWKITPKQVDDEATRVKVESQGGTPSPDQALATEISQFVERALKRIKPGLQSVLYEMLEAISRGYRIAEIIYEIPDDGEDAGKLLIKAIKPKPRTAAAFVVDVYYNIIGILGVIPGQGAPVVIESILGDPDQMPNLLPRRKFCVLSWQATNNDPRGNSHLRPIYNGWWTKRQAWGEYLKYMARYASPGVAGYTAEGAQSQVIDGKVVTPEQMLFQALQDYQNGGIAALAFGSKLELIQPTGGGEPFLNAIALSDAQIAKGILFQTLATEEGQHQARAAAQTHQDILGLGIAYGKSLVESMVANDLIESLVEFNYGRDGVRLAPTFSLGQTEQQDLAALMTAVAALFTSGYMHWSQMPGTDQMMAIPARDMEAQRQEIEQTAELAKAAATAPQAPVPPIPPRPSATSP